MNTARSWGPAWFRSALIVVAAAYLALVVLDTFFSGPLFRIVPGPLLYFAQIAGLFPAAKTFDTEFRAEAWDCAAQDFREIDIRPYFPILADNKENRFSRALYFYRRDREVVYALEKYLTDKCNADAPPGGRVGGMRFVAVRDSIPPVGVIARYHPKPLADYPEAARTPLFYTPMRMRRERCAEP